MEERLSYLEQKIGELTYRVNELEEMLESKSAPAVTDADNYGHIIKEVNGHTEFTMKTSKK